MNKLTRTKTGLWQVRITDELSVRTKSEGLPRDVFAGRAASSGSPSLSTVWTWILEA